MGNFSPEPSKADKVAMFLIALPYTAIGTAYSLAKRAFPSKQAPPAKKIEAAAPIEEVPGITENPKFEIADRTFCVRFGDLKVCFYQYVERQHIRAVARKGGCTKEVYFTPKIATDLDVPYNLDSAIAYIRQFGFKKGSIAGSRVPEAQTSAPQSSTVIDVESREAPTPKASNKPLPRLNSEVQPKKDRPFTGHVLALGLTVRPGRDGRPPYETYAVKLRSESGGMEKEFIGEHLAELVESKQVEVGDLVRIQLLGRNKFEVMNGNKREERTRNEYSLDLIN